MIEEGMIEKKTIEIAIVEKEEEMTGIAIETEKETEVVTMSVENVVEAEIEVVIVNQNRRVRRLLRNVPARVRLR